MLYATLFEHCGKHNNTPLLVWSWHASGGRYAGLHRGRAFDSQREIARYCAAKDSVRQSHREDVSVVLVEPQIPQNAGNVARTCAASRTALSLVGPTGFELDSTRLKRAGLDYWPYVCVKVHEDWAAFLQAYDTWPTPKRLVAFSKFATSNYAVCGTYSHGDVLIFGAETHGLPNGAPEDIQARGGILVKIAMDKTHVRSLNLATSVGIGLYEAIRQLDPPLPGQPVAAQIDQA